MTHALIRSIFVMMLVTFLAACQSTRILGQQAPTTADQLKHWEIKGRIGYSNGQDGGSASLIWKQQSFTTGQLDFSGPVGIGHARITYRPGSALLDDGKQQLEAPTPTLLAQQLTGLLLPIPALSWWVRGLPWPDATVTRQQRDEEGALVALEQAGWQLQFDRYQYQHDLRLPGRIKATRDDSRFTLLITRWTL